VTLDVRDYLLTCRKYCDSLSALSESTQLIQQSRAFAIMFLCMLRVGIHVGRRLMRNHK